MGRLKIKVAMPLEEAVNLVMFEPQHEGNLNVPLATRSGMSLNILKSLWITVTI